MHYKNLRGKLIIDTTDNPKYGLKKVAIKRQIPRGYGSKIGKLKNGVKVNTIKRNNRVFITNRVILTSEEVLQYYGEKSSSYLYLWLFNRIFNNRNDYNLLNISSLC